MKYFLSLFFVIAVFLTNTPPAVAVDCLSGGNWGICSSSGSCDAATNNWSNLTSPVNICLSAGGGCCVPKLPPGRNCSAGGANGICSAQSSCDSYTNNWSSAYLPSNMCLGFGNGCCVPKPPGTVTTNPSCGAGSLGVNTAIGCLMAGNPREFVGQLMGWGIGVGGGLAFLLIVYAGFQIATASGDPKRIQAGRELLFSALSGLVLIALSLVLLNFIGVKILNLDSLGFIL